MRAETAARMTAKEKETVGGAKVEWVQTVPTIFPTMEKAQARKCRKAIENKACESGGIGRRTRLRTVGSHTSNCHSIFVSTFESVQHFQPKTSTTLAQFDFLYRILYIGKSTTSVYTPLLARLPRCWRF
jgi:hypothetical protein